MNHIEMQLAMNTAVTGPRCPRYRPDGIVASSGRLPPRSPERADGRVRLARRRAALEIS